MSNEPTAQPRSWLKNGNPVGDQSKARRCGAKTKREHRRCLAKMETHVTLLWNEDHQYRLHMDDLPDIWRANFRQMARWWAAVSWILEYGSVSLVRYAAAPNSLRDYLEFPD